MNGFDLAKHTVIVVEDEAFTRQTVVRLLIGMGATNVVQAEDGEAALAESWTLPGGPVVMLSDFNMPKIDGLELLKTIRMGQCGLNRATPFIMLTAYSDRDLVDVALKLDVSAFLVKPVSRAALEKRFTHLARTEKDISWLKTTEIYDAVSTTVSDEVLNPGSPAAAAPKPAIGENKGMAKKGRRKAGGGGGEGGDDEDEAPMKISAEASEAAADLLKHLLSKEDEAEVAAHHEASRTKFVDRLANFSGEDNVAANVRAGIERLYAELGASEASGILQALDRLERDSTLTMGDIADILNTGGDAEPSRTKQVVTTEWQQRDCKIEDVPEAAVAAQNIFSSDGSVLISSGTQLTPTVIRLLGQLDRRNALTLPSDAKTGRPVVQVMLPPGAEDTPEVVARAPRALARRLTPPARPRGPERSVDPTGIQPGQVLSRDVHTTNGAIYLGAGTTLTERHIGVLDNLYETGKLNEKIWISAGSPK